MTALPTSLASGHEPSPDEFQAMLDILSALSGLTAPISTTTDTGSLGATEGQDTNLGNYTFTAVAGYRYQVMLQNISIVSGTAGDKYIVRARDGGLSTPTASSTIVGETLFTAQVTNQPQPIPPLTSFVASSTGTHIIGLFVIRSTGSNTATVTSSGHYASGTLGRELFVRFVGTN